MLFLVTIFAIVMMVVALVTLLHDAPETMNAGITLLFPGMFMFGAVVVNVNSERDHTGSVSALIIMIVVLVLAFLLLEPVRKTT
jgi:hypothetical protein